MIGLCDYAVKRSTMEQKRSENGAALRLVLAIMWQNEAQRNRNEAETEQFYDWSQRLCGQTQHNGIETKQKQNRASAKPPALRCRHQTKQNGAENGAVTKRSFQRVAPPPLRRELHPSNHSPGAASFVTSFVLLDNHHRERSRTEQNC